MRATNASRRTGKSFEKRRAWQQKMYEAGWVGIAWPKQYGGRGADLMEQVIFDEEYSRASAPVLPGYSGIALCGPTLMQWGTDEQKKRFLPAHPQWRGDLVPGLFRTRRWL